MVATPPSGSTFALDTTTVNLSATDANGNTGTASFHVTIRDTTPPVISATADITGIEATGPGGAVVMFTAPTASDLVDGAVSVSADHASGSSFPVGTTTVHFTATDAHGNHATSTFHVTVVDSTAPVISPPTDITAEATSAAGAVVTFDATASDVVDGSLIVVANPPSGSTSRSTPPRSTSAPPTLPAT